MNSAFSGDTSAAKLAANFALSTASLNAARASGGYERKLEAPLPAARF